MSPVRGDKKVSLEAKTGEKEAEDPGRSLRDIDRRGKRGQARIWSDSVSLKVSSFQKSYLIDTFGGKARWNTIKTIQFICSSELIMNLQ